MLLSAHPAGAGLGICKQLLYLLPDVQAANQNMAGLFMHITGNQLTGLCRQHLYLCLYIGSLPSCREFYSLFRCLGGQQRRPGANYLIFGKVVVAFSHTLSSLYRKKFFKIAASKIYVVSWLRGPYCFSAFAQCEGLTHFSFVLHTVCDHCIDLDPPPGSSSYRRSLYRQIHSSAVGRCRQLN